MAPFPLFTTATVCIATTVLRSAAEDGIMSPAARRKLGIDNATLPPIEPALVWDAPCTVIEPSPPQTHYMLAFALSTMTSRIWMARAMVRHWLHRHPRLIVSQWHDDDSNSRNDDGIGMRWGIGLTWRGIAPVMCLADALCGRFDWVLFCDDDTVVDVEAVSMLLSNSLAQSAPRQPYFFSFAPQPWPTRKDWRPSLLGCPGNVTRYGKHNHAKWDATAVRKPCTGPPVPFDSPKRNMGIMWPYGGVGFLLSKGAVDVLVHGPEAVHSARPTSCLERPSSLDGRAAGSMRAHKHPHALRCLRELTCPWGAMRKCTHLPPPFNHTTQPRAEPRPGFCAQRENIRFNKDSRSCGGPDVQFASCLAAAGVFVTDLSPLDARIRPSGRGNSYWTRWTASVKQHRLNQTDLSETVRVAAHCGLGSGPLSWDHQSTATCERMASRRRVGAVHRDAAPVSRGRGLAVADLKVSAAAAPSVCNLSAWSSDGFGHQLSGALSCEALALSEPSLYRYVRTRHLEFEHSPTGSDALLELLHTPTGPGDGGDPPLVVKPKRYHAVCDGDKKRRPPPCHAGRLIVCDNCYNMVNMTAATSVRAEMVRRVRERLRRAVPGGTCEQRFDVCVHMRALSTTLRPSSAHGLFVTPMWAERDSMRRRSVHAAWWGRAVDTAASERVGDRAEQPASVLVHTNNVGMSAVVFGEDGVRANSRGDVVTTRGPNVSMLHMLHELVFCCEQLVVSISALSSVAGFATLARGVYAPIGRNPHLGYTYQKVPCAGRAGKAPKEPECEADWKGIGRISHN